MGPLTHSSLSACVDTALAWASSRPKEAPLYQTGLLKVVVTATGTGDRSPLKSPSSLHSRLPGEPLRPQPRHSFHRAGLQATMGVTVLMSRPRVARWYPGGLQCGLRWEERMPLCRALSPFLQVKRVQTRSGPQVCVSPEPPPH